MSEPYVNRHGGTAQPKPVPHKLLADARKAALKALDDKERQKCHVRSGGQCEVFERVGMVLIRCKRHATQNHHLIGGSGRRNVGKSILAEHRLDVCDRCHADITGNVLVPIDGTLKEVAARVRYERLHL